MSADAVGRPALLSGEDVVQLEETLLLKPLLTDEIVQRCTGDAEDWREASTVVQLDQIHAGAGDGAVPDPLKPSAQAPSARESEVRAARFAGTVDD